MLRLNIKPQHPPSILILLTVVVTAPHVTVSLTSAVFHVQTQQVMSSVTLAVEQFHFRAQLNFTSKTKLTCNQ